MVGPRGRPARAPETPGRRRVTHYQVRRRHISAGQLLSTSPSEESFPSTVEPLDAAVELPSAALPAKRARIVLSPQDLPVLADLAATHFAEGNPRLAKPWLKRAAAFAPADAVVQLNDATASMSLGDVTGASRSARRALASAPSLHEAAVSLAEANARSDPAISELWLSRSFASTFDRAGIWRLRASIARDHHKLGRAMFCGRTSVVLSPGDPNLLSDLARTMTSLGMAAAAVASLRRALGVDKSRFDLQNLLVLAMAYESAPTAAWSTEAIRAMPRQCAPTAPGRHSNSPEQGRRLRVGYVSSDFRDHPVGHAVAAMLAAHDTTAIEIACYSSAVKEDSVTDRFRAMATLWRSCAGLGDRSVAETMRNDGIDIAVHLAGRFANNRPRLAAHRPAPVQVAMHDLTTTGQPTIDAWLTDAVLHPPGTAEAFAEPLHRLPFFYAFARPPEVPSSPLPSETNGFVTFGSANNPAKITTSVAEAWGEILRAVPGSRLWLKFFSRTDDDDVRRVLTERFSAVGVAAERLVFPSGPVDRESHLRSLGAVDVALDPFPFNGANTSFEALWMGIPLITLAGDRFIGRVAEALLREVGLPDLIATNREDYVARAVGLAADRVRLARLRSELRGRVLRSRLLDVTGLARAVEATYRGLWHRWCAEGQVT